MSRRRRIGEPPGRTSGRRGGQVRIIGGSWRGRRLDVVDQNALRPTPDRVRETLFNWLMPVLPGARCLDLFAGTGILGLEAESRGAGTVMLIEHDAALVRALRSSVTRLGARVTTIVESDAFQWLKRADRDGSGSEPYDIVFVDPPYAQRWELKALQGLSQYGLVHQDSLVYVEAAEALQPDGLPPGWDIYRAKSAGQVRYHLLTPAGT
ncbi:MAG: 16S rRNA (guanine(966)-N(2))-methyltransferase RsmD [Pseudomonadota bacterium]